MIDKFKFWCIVLAQQYSENFHVYFGAYVNPFSYM